jgi:hypothetical protein
MSPGLCTIAMSDEGSVSSGLESVVDADSLICGRETISRYTTHVLVGEAV